MNRSEFKRLRDLPDKRVVGDIRLVQRNDIAAVWEAKDIPIINAQGLDARLTIQIVPETGAKIINVKIPGVGSIYRLEVDSRLHKPVGRSHKHALRTPHCPRENLKREIGERNELDGRSLHEVFNAFCRAMNIVHEHALIVPIDGSDA